MEDIKGVVKNPSAWVPQLHFDLIARVIPGAVLLVAFFVIFGSDSLIKLVAGQVAGAHFSESFLILSIVLLVGLFASYVAAVLLWGMLHSFIKLLKHLIKKDFDVETFIDMSTMTVAERYEVIKKTDILCGNRITKLKAEIHMATTLIAGIIALAVAHFVSSKSVNFAWIYLILLWGAFGALLHFRSRLSQVLNAYKQPAIADKKNSAN